MGTGGTGGGAVAVGLLGQVPVAIGIGILGQGLVAHLGGDAVAESVIGEIVLLGSGPGPPYGGEIPFLVTILQFDRIINSIAQNSAGIVVGKECQSCIGSPTKLIRSHPNRE